MVRSEGMWKDVDKKKQAVTYGALGRHIPEFVLWRNPRSS
jgi:hypothetical protein